MRSIFKLQKLAKTQKTPNKASKTPQKCKNIINNLKFLPRNVHVLHRVQQRNGELCVRGEDLSEAL